MRSKKKIYGVLGFPVRHSLSPLMHNAAFAYLKINSEYKLFEIKPEELSEFLSSLPKKNISGLNITIPYKEKIIPFLKSISNGARLIGAVNTIKVAQSGLEGFNTDGEGFLKHLSEELKFNPQGKRISILGAGGAARAVSVSLAKAGARQISIYDIDAARAKLLHLHLKENFQNTEFRLATSVEELGIRESNLLINATPIGMKESDPSLVDQRFIQQDLLVYDLIYNPKETKLLTVAKEKGAGISNGLGMLLYQGMIAFEIWTGKSAPKEIMQQALEEGVNKL